MISRECMRMRNGGREENIKGRRVTDSEQAYGKNTAGCIVWRERRGVFHGGLYNAIQYCCVGDSNPGDRPQRLIWGD